MLEKDLGTANSAVYEVSDFLLDKALALAIYRTQQRNFILYTSVDTARLWVVLAFVVYNSAQGRGSGGGKGGSPPVLNRPGQAPLLPPTFCAKPLVLWAGHFRQAHTLMNGWTSRPLVTPRTRVEKFARHVRAKTDGHVYSLSNS